MVLFIWYFHNTLARYYGQKEVMGRIGGIHPRTFKYILSNVLTKGNECRIFADRGCRIFAGYMKEIMKRKSLKTLEKRISYRLARSKFDVVMRKDFKDLSDYDQIGRILRKFVSDGKLVRIGYGLYAKTTLSPLSGKMVPRQDIQSLAEEALSRLKVKVYPSSFDLAYNEGRSTQIPSGRVVGVKNRVSRKIGYDNKKVIFEHVTRKPRTN